MNLIPKTIPYTPIKNKLFSNKNILLQVARFDAIHPVVSGNKLFKLFYYFEDAKTHNCKTIVTIGGAYSNHLIATAYACNQKKINAIGLVRGEEVVNNLSETLQQCRDLGMQLFFVDRNTFSLLDKSAAAAIVSLKEEEFIFIPEGGYAPLGAKGAGLMMDYLLAEKPTHIILPVGTATTLAGLISRKIPDVEIIAVPVLKNLNDVSQRLQFLLQEENYQPPEIWKEFHFGGYAKKTTELINFMNQLYDEHQLPTDFVYTAKMMFAVLKKTEQDYFEEGSNIIALHTGGLQGNRSLPENGLNF